MGTGGAAPRRLAVRRGWDSNPRYPCEYNSLAGSPIRPLSHLSRLRTPGAAVAEREGFEPPEHDGSTVFKTASFDHSDTSPSAGTLPRVAEYRCRPPLCQFHALPHAKSIPTNTLRCHGRSEDAQTVSAALSTVEQETEGARATTPAGCCAAGPRRGSLVTGWSPGQVRGRSAPAPPAAVPSVSSRSARRRPQLNARCRPRALLFVQHTSARRRHRGAVCESQTA